MHYFSIHTPAGEHLGFLIMLADDENEQPPQSGRFAIKLQSEALPQDTAAVRALAEYQDSEQALYWALAKDGINLFSEQENIGRLRQEFLTISGQTLLINDISGMI